MNSVSTEDQLEAHPIDTNQQLLEFRVRSQHIFWNNLIKPLSTRGEPRNLGENFPIILNHDKVQEKSNKREVFVCHDMMGNYLEDRYYSKSKKWDDYRFYHWSGIDYFCYFSHRYVTIPPSGWINAAHLHGVRVLGTYITENESGSRLLNEVLSSQSFARNIAESLVRMAVHYNFEGWLINIECNVAPQKLNMLLYFLSTLTTRMHQRIPNSVIIWYDSVIYESGTVSWQNELNPKNINFFKSCDGILLNYAWNDGNLRNTENIVNEVSRDRMSKVFVGIDVFGRSKPAKFETSRIVEQIAKYDFSIGIFAPAWTFESLGERLNIKLPLGDEYVNTSFIKRNDYFWNRIWKHLPIRPYNKIPFYTDFCLGSGKFSFKFGRRDEKKFFNLSKQSLQPSIPLTSYAERYFDDAFHGGSCLKIIKYNEFFRLFTTDFRIEGVLVFAYATKLHPLDAGQIDCVLNLCDMETNRKCEMICGHYENNLQRGQIYLHPISENESFTIMQFLHIEQVRLRLPFTLGNDWIVNYFIAIFDKPVHVTDIGACFRTRYETNNLNGFLGAMYLHGGRRSIEHYMNISVNDYFI